MEPCDICHSQPCRPDCADPLFAARAAYLRGGYAFAVSVAHDRIQAEVDMVSRLCDLVGKSAAMAVLREFRVTKREV